MERIPAPEFSEEELKSIRFLKENLRDSETQKLLNIWIDEQAENAKRINTPRANIDIDLKQAKLYAAAGLADGARESAEAALEQAWNERIDDLYDQALALLDSIDKNV